MPETEFRDRDGVLVAVLRDDGSLYVRRGVLDPGIVEQVASTWLTRHCLVAVDRDEAARLEALALKALDHRCGSDAG